MRSRDGSIHTTLYNMHYNTYKRTSHHNTYIRFNQMEIVQINLFFKKVLRADLGCEGDLDLAQVPKVVCVMGVAHQLPNRFRLRPPRHGKHANCADALIVLT